MLGEHMEQGLPDAPAGLFFKLWNRLVAPTQTLRVTTRQVAPRRWSRGLRIAMVSDLHMAEPYMPLSRLDEVVARTQALQPDLIVLPGDLIPGPSMVTTVEPPLEQIAARLARLRAPLGVYAVLGNHDWWSDAQAQARRAAPVAAGDALEAAGIPVLSNRAVRLPDGTWLAGLESQEALRRSRADIEGLDDLPATLAQVPDGADVILLAHEPYVFGALTDDRVALTLSGHTHGGQISIMGWAPVVPREINRRYLYGHVREGDRHLIVSGGIGYSKLPIRVGVLPEITLVEVAASG